MTPQRLSRRFGSDPSSARIATKRRFRRVRPAAAPADDTAVLTFLYEVIVGDDTWSLAEVQQLIALHDQADLRQESEARFEDSRASQF